MQAKNNESFYNINSFKIEEGKIEILESIIPFLKNDYTDLNQDYNEKKILSFSRLVDEDNGEEFIVPVKLDHKNTLKNDGDYKLHKSQDYCLVTIKPQDEEDYLLSIIYTPDKMIYLTRDGVKLLNKQKDCTLWNGLGDFYKNRPSKVLRK